MTATEASVLILVAVLGAIVGSFLSVVVERVPAGRSLLRPRSACDRCGVAIRPRDNIPVLSFVLLRGRCRDCNSPIPRSILGIEIATAVAFVLVVLTVPRPSATLPAVLTVAAFAALAAASIALTVIDVRLFRLPDPIVFSALAALVLLLVPAALLSGDSSALWRASAGAGALCAGYLVLWGLSRGTGMGFGDVKLALPLGFALAYLGWSSLAVGALAAFMLGGLYAVVLLVTGRVGRKAQIPFGPWMLAGAWTAIVAGQAIATGYLSWFGLN